MARDKRKLLEQLIRQMGSESEKIAEAAESARDACIKAPGRMQTRYGCEKEEYGYLADGLNLRRQEIDVSLHRISGTQLPKDPKQITEGTLVRLRYNGCEEEYLVMPYGGGQFIETEDGEITVITPESPLAQSMMGLRKGDNFSFSLRDREREYQVVEIE